MGEASDPEQQYSLRWNDFHASILSSFRHLRDEEDFVDVTLACDGCSFQAHKVVLSACSPYFRRLLKANPCSHPIVILRDVREKDMESLLRFMYNGEVHIGQEQLSDFLKTAQMLQVRGLADVPTKDNQKSTPTSNSLPWSQSGELREHFQDDALSPPPKRNRTNEHRFSPSPASSATNNNNNGDTMMRDTLLGQALEGSSALQHSGGTQHQNKGNSDSSLQAQSTGEDSNSSDTALSDRGPIVDLIRPKSEPNDYGSVDENNHHPGNGNLGMDVTRTPTFPAALLGLQGIPGFPGPSGLHNSNQDTSFGNLPISGTKPSSADWKQYRLHLLLEVRFQDSRLAYHGIAPHILKVTGEEQLKNLIWVPHIFIANEQSSTVMGTRAKDILVTVYPDGVVIIAVRLKTTLYCWMKLHKFPFDDQQCPLTLESSSLYKTDRLLLEWEKNTPVTITPHSYLTEYRIIGVSTNTTSGTTSATLMESGIVGNYSALVVTFHISRKMGFYAMDYYVPSILLVAISWVSFWLDANALSGRITLGCSTMLTFIMLSSKTGRDLPKVSYIKASEIWFMTCTAFIFGSLVEFAFVNTIWRRRNNVQLKKVNSKYILKSTLTPKLARKELDQRKPSLERSTSYPPNVLQRKMGLEMISKQRPSMMQSDISLVTFSERSQETSSNFLSVPGTGSSSSLAEEATTERSFDGRESSPGNQGSSSSLRARVRRLSVAAFTTMTPQDIAKWIDTRSRVVFPVCFLIFNALYWTFVWL